MKAVICDRCGKTEKVIEGSLCFVSPYSIQEIPGFKQYELCESCAKSFKSWVNMKEINENEDR